MRMISDRHHQHPQCLHPSVRQGKLACECVTPSAKSARQYSGKRAPFKTKKKQHRPVAAPPPSGGHSAHRSRPRVCVSRRAVVHCRKLVGIVLAPPQIDRVNGFACENAQRSTYLPVGIVPAPQRGRVNGFAGGIRAGISHQECGCIYARTPGSVVARQRRHGSLAADGGGRTRVRWQVFGNVILPPRLHLEAMTSSTSSARQDPQHVMSSCTGQLEEPGDPPPRWAH